MKWICSVLVGLLAMSLLWAQGDYKKGVSYYQQKQYQKAISEFEPIVKEQPDYEFGHRIIGFSYLQLGNHPKAISALREAIRLKPREFATYRALALAYFNSSRYREALPTLEQAEQLATSPREKYEIHRLRGASAFNLGQYRVAVSSLEQAVSIQRGNADDVLQLGLAYFQLEENQKARQYLEQALALRPGQEAAQKHLNQLQFREASNLIQAKRYDEAGRLLRTFLDKNPQDGEGWFNLGLAYLFGGNLEAAEEAFQRTVRITPDNIDAHNRLGFIFEKTKRYQDALKHYERANALRASAEFQESIKRVKERISRGNTE